MTGPLYICINAEIYLMEDLHIDGCVKLINKLLLG